MIMGLLWWAGAGATAAWISSDIKETRRQQQEMQSWSVKKLYAFAGMKHKHDKEIRSYAYNLAKEKQFNSL